MLWPTLYQITVFLFFHEIWTKQRQQRLISLYPCYKWTYGQTELAVHMTITDLDSNAPSPHPTHIFHRTQNFSVYQFMHREKVEFSKRMAEFSIFKNMILSWRKYIFFTEKRTIANTKVLAFLCLAIKRKFFSKTTTPPSKTILDLTMNEWIEPTLCRITSHAKYQTLKTFQKILDVFPYTMYKDNI